MTWHVSSLSGLALHARCLRFLNVCGMTVCLHIINKFKLFKQLVQLQVACMIEVCKNLLVYLLPLIQVLALLDNIPAERQFDA